MNSSTTLIYCYSYLKGESHVGKNCYFIDAKVALHKPFELGNNRLEH